MRTGAGPAPGAQAVDSRMPWADIARALSIVLVVAYHAGVSAIDALLPPDASWTADHWRTANLVLVPLRMPLFFVVSGVLAAGALARPWAAVRRPRVLNLLWAYMLWSIIFAATAWPRYAADAPVEYFVAGMRDMLVAASPYWFIAVLPVFFLVTRWGRDRPWLLVTVLFGAYLASPHLASALKDLGPAFTEPATGVRRLTEFAMWFTAGYALSGPLKTFGAKTRPITAAVASILCIPLCWMAVMGDLAPAAERIVKLCASVSSILAVLALSTLLGALPTIARLGRHLGSRTLIIYLVHPLVLNMCVVIARRVHQVHTGPVPLAAELLLVPAVVVLSVLISLAVERLTDRWGADWLFEMPARRRDLAVTRRWPTS